MNDIASNALALLGSLPAPNVSLFSGALAGMAFVISLVSRHLLTVVGTILAIAIASFLFLEMQSVGALVASGGACLYALGGVTRREHQIRLRRIESSIQGMSGMIDTFLDGLERRTREHDRAISAVVVEDKAPLQGTGHAIAAE